MNKLLLRKIAAGLGIAAVGWSLWLSASSAGAQQPQPGKAPDPAPTARPGAAQPGATAPPAPTARPGLPPGHPPVGKQPDAQGQLPPRGRTPDQIRDLIERSKQQQKGPGQAAAPSKVRYPTDEHGNCLRRGPHDPPPDINLVHGWLGVNDEKAAPPAPQRTGALDWAWWKWRLTPYPWRYENHDDHCDPRNEPVPLIANIINVAALFYLLARFGRKPIKEGLEKRKRNVMAEIDRARAIKASAVERLQKYKHDLEHLDEKLDALRHQYVTEGAVEEQRVRQDAAETLARMLGDAEFRIAQESKSAREELSREALEQALRAAEDLLKKSLTPADHQRLAEQYLESLPAALHDGGRR
jgi:F-type H+-transporting ATPase subunit b